MTSTTIFAFSIANAQNIILLSLSRLIFPTIFLDLTVRIHHSIDSHNQFSGKSLSVIPTRITATSAKLLVQDSKKSHREIFISSTRARITFWATICVLNLIKGSLADLIRIIISIGLILITSDDREFQSVTRGKLKWALNSSSIESLMWLMSW